MHKLHLVPWYSTNQINYNQPELEKLLTHFNKSLQYKDWMKNTKAIQIKLGKFYKIPNMKQQRQKINCERYCDLLWNWLKPATKKKSCGLLSSGMCLQHDTVGPLAARHIMK